MRLVVTSSSGIWVSSELAASRMHETVRRLRSWAGWRAFAAIDALTRESMRGWLDMTRVGRMRILYTAFVSGHGFSARTPLSEIAGNILTRFSPTSIVLVAKQRHRRMNMRRIALTALGFALLLSG